MCFKLVKKKHSTPTSLILEYARTHERSVNYQDYRAYSKVFAGSIFKSRASDNAY